MFVRASQLYNVETGERTNVARSAFRADGGATDAEVRQAIESVDEGGESA
jgi:hypothetical protein